MKTTIYYFTGTGNSLAIAKKIQERLNDCDLVPIKNEIKKNNIQIESKNVGIIFPSFFTDVPPIVLNFLNKANWAKIEYLFVVVTAGSMAGNSFESINNILIRQNKRINLEYKISLPGNYLIPWYYKLANRSENGKKSLFKKSEKEVVKLVRLIKEKKEKKYKFAFLIEKAMINNQIDFAVKNNIHEWDKYFYSDNNCNSCNICEKVCPVQNIIIKNGKPYWNQNCQLCMACLQLCPKESIQYKKDTLNKKRYHHPEITVKEIIN